MPTRQAGTGSDMDDTEFERAKTREQRDHLQEPDTLEGTPQAHRHQARRLVFAAGTVGLICVVLLAALRYSGMLTAPSVAMPTATEIAPIVADQMTATAVPAQFQALEQRPLHLPTLTLGAACPLVPTKTVPYATYGPALGEGPVYATGFDRDGTLSAATPVQFGGGGSPWGGMKIVWFVAPGTTGPAIVRGQQIDGSHALRFNGGLDEEHYLGDWAVAPLLSELRLVLYSDVHLSWGSYVRLQVPGCYAMQVDGLSFSEVIIFRAVMN